MLKIIGAACAALLLTACASLGGGSVTMSAQRAATVAADTYAVTCGTVDRLHTAGTLTGAAFNKARAACIAADDNLDAAHALLAAGKTVEAAARISAALGQVDTAKAAVPD